MTDAARTNPSIVDQMRDRVGKQLGFALRDPNPNIRFLALEALHRLRFLPDETSLVPLLKDNDRFVRWKAIQAAGVMRRVETRETLRLQLESTDLNSRAFAAASLGQIGDPQDLPLLRECFGRDLAPRVRQALIRAMAGYDDPRALEMLAVGCRDHDLGVRLDAAEVLGVQARRAPTDAACDLLVTLLERETHTRVFATALLSLGRFQRDSLIPYFQHSLLHQESRIRANAVEALGMYPFPRVREILAPYVNDPANRVRANVIHVFYQGHCGAEVAGQVAQLLDSGTRWDRSSGAWLAGMWRLDEHLYRLVELLSDEEAVVAERAGWALGRLTVPGVFKAIADAYTVASTWSLGFLIQSMRATAGPDDVPTLVALMKREGDAQLRAQFIDVLTALGVESQTPQMLQYAASPDHRVRGAALRFLGTLAPARHADLLLGRMTDPNSKIRAMCAQLLFDAGDFRGVKHLAESLTDQNKLERVQTLQTIREIASIAADREARRVAAVEPPVPPRVPDAASSLPPPG